MLVVDLVEDRAEEFAADEAGSGFEDEDHDAVLGLMDDYRSEESARYEQGKGPLPGNGDDSGARRPVLDFFCGDSVGYVDQSCCSR